MQNAHHWQYQSKFECVRPLPGPANSITSTHYNIGVTFHKQVQCQSKFEAVMPVSGTSTSLYDYTAHPPELFRIRRTPWGETFSALRSFAGTATSFSDFLGDSGALIPRRRASNSPAAFWNPNTPSIVVSVPVFSGLDSSVSFKRRLLYQSQFGVPLVTPPIPQPAGFESGVIYRKKLLYQSRFAVTHVLPPLSYMTESVLEFPQAYVIPTRFEIVRPLPYFASVTNNLTLSASLSGSLSALVANFENITATSTFSGPVTFVGFMSGGLAVTATMSSQGVFVGTTTQNVVLNSVKSGGLVFAGNITDNAGTTQGDTGYLFGIYLNQPGVVTATDTLSGQVSFLGNFSDGATSTESQGALATLRAHNIDIAPVSAATAANVINFLNIAEAVLAATQADGLLLIDRATADQIAATESESARHAILGNIVDSISSGFTTSTPGGFTPIYRQFVDMSVSILNTPQNIIRKSSGVPLILYSDYVLWDIYTGEAVPFEDSNLIFNRDRTKKR